MTKGNRTGKTPRIKTFAERFVRKGPKTAKKRSLTLINTEENRKKAGKQQ
jgi:hypothetical protein